MTAVLLGADAQRRGFFASSVSAHGRLGEVASDRCGEFKFEEPGFG